MASRIPLWRRKIPRYPVYWEGNPQNRVVLCQFWMKLIKPKRDTPPDTVHFIVHPQMSKFDIKQYLEKIYQVPVLNVKTGLREGKDVFSPILGSTPKVWKEEDYKVAHVQLVDGHAFEFPNIFKSGKSDEKDIQTYKDIKREEIKEQHQDWERMSLPPWFR